MWLNRAPMLNDAHCHFFSTEFFATLARQRPELVPIRPPMREDVDRELIAATMSEKICEGLQWEAPGSVWMLADRWARELDAHGVGRAALIASVPSDETSVAAAVARHPDRFVGFFMLDVSSPEPVARARRAIFDFGLRGICLFPAMHHVPLDDERVRQVVEVAAAKPGVAVFVHCGVLSVGIRRRLGLPSRFDLRLGDPLAVARLAQSAPRVPFIIPHFGAGLFRETLMAADVAPNIYLDTSSSNGWTRYTPGLTLETVFKTTLGVVGPARLLFGTDSSCFPRGWQRAVYDAQKNALAAIGCSADDEARIFGENFDLLFPVADAAASPVA